MMERDATDEITVNYNNILVFLQEILVKTPRFVATPLSLHAEKQTQEWFL